MYDFDFILVTSRLFFFFLEHILRVYFDNFDTCF